MPGIYLLVLLIMWCWEHCNYQFVYITAQPIFKRQQNNSFTRIYWINPGSSGEFIVGWFCQLIELKKIENVMSQTMLWGAWSGTIWRYTNHKRGVPLSEYYYQSNSTEEGYFKYQDKKNILFQVGIINMPKTCIGILLLARSDRSASAVLKGEYLYCCSKIIGLGWCSFKRRCYGPWRFFKKWDNVEYSTTPILGIGGIRTIVMLVGRG